MANETTKQNVKTTNDVSTSSKMTSNSASSILVFGLKTISPISMFGFETISVSVSLIFCSGLSSISVVGELMKQSRPPDSQQATFLSSQTRQPSVVEFSKIDTHNTTQSRISANRKTCLLIMIVFKKTFKGSISMKSK